MPNPLTRLTVRPPGTNPNRPRAITPVPEHVEGTNFPWRGPEEHGVTPNAKPHDPDVYGVDPEDPHTHTIVTVDHPEKVPDPIPVRIVQEFGKEYREFGTDRLSLDFTTANNPSNRAVELVGRADDRTAVRIRNCDAANILLIGTSREETAMRGYPVYPGQEIALVTESPVFAVVVSSTYSAPTAVSLVGLLTEYVVREQ